jgi:hypothetical protein
MIVYSRIPKIDCCACFYFGKVAKKGAAEVTWLMGSAGFSLGCLEEFEWNIQLPFFLNVVTLQVLSDASQGANH